MLRIALSTRVVNAESYDEPRDALSHDWLKILQTAGSMPFLVPNTLYNLNSFLDHVEPHLVLLTGGDDIGCFPERDKTEIALLEYSIARGLPVLGVCRGLQLINKYYGGSLTHIDNHIAVLHEVIIGAKWRAIYGASVCVNSYHAQGLKPENLGQGLIPVAHDSDGFVEALVHESLPLASVMWHPERNGGLSADMALIDKLVRDGVFWK